MKKISINVVVNLYDDYVGESPIEIEISDESYEKLVPLCEKIEAEELDEDDSCQLLEESIPEVVKEIEQNIDKVMPSNIEPDEDEGETIDDYSWPAQYNYIIL